jgi:EmrB/QacA subfamily drug resistance transporter
MSSLDTNIVLIALPTIASSLRGMNALDVLWVLLGYQLVVASVLVNFGRLSDIFGRVRLYKMGFAIFTIGSGLCSISQTGAELIGFRLIQAVGAGFLFSNSAAIVTDAFPPEERGSALGINQISIVVGSVLGLVLGGILTSLIGWSSIFWVNLPIGTFATVWAHFRLKEISSPSHSRKQIDVTGNLTFAGGLVTALLALTLYAIVGISLLLTLGLLGLSAIFFVLFFFEERRVADPMFDLSLFSNRIFSIGNETIFLNALSRGSFTLVMVFYLQGPIMHFTPLQAGLFLVPLSVALSIMGPISGTLSDRYGQRLFVLVGLALSTIGFLIMTSINGVLSFYNLIIPLILIGAGMGIFASPNRASIMSAAPAERRGLASGISTTLVNVGNTLSIGIAFILMGSSIPRSALDSIFAGTSSGLLTGSLTEFVHSVHIVFIASAAMLILSIMLYITFAKKSRWEHAIVS